MNYENVDNEELLHIALDAMNGNREAEAISMLRLILSRDPEHTNAMYLLAAQHAQIGIFDRAEEGMRAVIERSPEFAIARFQLGQLLALKGAAAESREILSPLFAGEGALSAYARGMAALSAEDIAAGLRELELGLTLPQEIPVLAADMQRLRDNLIERQTGTSDGFAAVAPTSAPIYLAGYGYGRSDDGK